MVSDVLFEAIAEIKDYRERMPDVYDYLLPELDLCVRVMTAMQIMLDTPPTKDADGANSEFTNSASTPPDPTFHQFDEQMSHHFQSQLSRALDDYRAASATSEKDTVTA
jgi:hypothetical protein